MLGRLGLVGGDRGPHLVEGDAQELRELGGPTLLRPGDHAQGQPPNLQGFAPLAGPPDCTHKVLGLRAVESVAYLQLTT